jgi:L-ascorbate metabolism protein UlaG (beta-lactamase superfamily)
MTQPAMSFRAKPRNPFALLYRGTTRSFDAAKFTLSERSESNGLRSGRLRHGLRASIFIRHLCFVILHVVLAQRILFGFVIPMNTQLTWYGQSAFKIVTPGGKVLLVDPWLTNPVFEKAKEEIAALTRVDLILVTHGHSDHVGDAVEIGKKTGAKLVATFDLSAALVTALGYPKELADVQTTGHIGGTLTLLEGEVAVTFVPAWHGSGVSPGENMPPVYAGPAAGVIIALRQGPTIYHTGDTDLFSDMALMKRFHKIDVMLVCIGDHFTMGPARAAEAVKLVKPRTAIPMHYATFPVLTGTPEAFRRELKKRKSTAKLRVMQVGETIALGAG